MGFKERMGFESEKILQINEMNSNTRRRLWDLCYCIFGGNKEVAGQKYAEAMGVYINIFKKMRSAFESQNSLGYHLYDIDNFRNLLKEYITSGSVEWYDICELLEYIEGNHIEDISIICNKIFEEEKFGYRFINKELLPITNEQEIAEIKLTSTLTSESAGHFQKAMQFFGEKQNPQYGNVVEECIKGIEALLREITGDHNQTLGSALKILKKDGNRPEYITLWEGLEKLWGFTSNNIRHAEKPDGIEVDFATAKFVLVLSSSIANYINSMK